MIDRALAIAGLALAILGLVLPALVPAIPGWAARGGVVVGLILLAGAGVVFFWPAPAERPEISVTSIAQQGGQTAAAITNNGPVFNAPVTLQPPSTTKSGRLAASEVDGNLLGFSGYIVIRIDDITQIRRKYVFEFATSEGARAAFYLSASNRFTFSVTDIHRESYPVEIVLGPDGIPMNQWVVIFFEEGSTSNASFMRVLVNDKVVVSRDLDFPIDLGSRDWKATIGADAAGENGGAYALGELVAWPMTLPQSKRTAVFKNAGTFFGIAQGQ